jgi:hypothetical protein
LGLVGGTKNFKLANEEEIELVGGRRYSNSLLVDIN